MLLHADEDIELFSDIGNVSIHTYPGCGENQAGANITLTEYSNQTNAGTVFIEPGYDKINQENTGNLIIRSRECLSDKTYQYHDTKIDLMGDINITGDYLKNGEKIGLWEGSYNDGWSIEAAGVDYNGVHYKGAKIRINTGSVDYYNGFAAGGWIEFIAGESSDERRAGAIFMEDPDDTENFVIIKNGKLGIKHQPYNGDAELTVNGDARITGKLYVDNFWQQREEGLFYHYKDKKICIGTYNFNNDGLLNVNGKINAEEIEIIDVYPADFVFDTDYNLKSIDQLEEYIKKNKKLPDIPSGKEMQKNGMNIAKMNGLLLQKIEELTLYMIELKKENEKLKEQNEKIKEVMREIEKLKAENK